MVTRPEKLDMRHLWVCVSGLIAFPAYWLTLAPTLQVADAGEQIAPAHFLGVSHPTGTPLHLLLMKGRLHTSHFIKTDGGFKWQPHGLVFHLAGGDDPPGTFPWGEFLAQDIRQGGHGYRGDQVFRGGSEGESEEPGGSGS